MRAVRTRTHILASQSLLGVLGLGPAPSPRPTPYPSAGETSRGLEPACLQCLKLPDSLPTAEAGMGEERLGSAFPTTLLWKGLQIQGGRSGEEGAQRAGRGKTYPGAWRTFVDFCPWWCYGADCRPSDVSRLPSPLCLFPPRWVLNSHRRYFYGTLAWE